MNGDGLSGMILMGIVRHLITTVAGGYVAKGLLTHDQQTTLVSGAMVAFGLALSIYNKSQVAKKGT